MQVEQVVPDLAGQRRERADANEPPAPPTKQVRNDDKEKEDTQTQDMEQDLDKVCNHTHRTRSSSLSPRPLGPVVALDETARACAQNCRLERQMYLENDEQAYALDRQLEKQRKFHFQRNHAQEEAKLFHMTRKNKSDTTVKRIKLSATGNNRIFRPEDISAQVLATLQEVDIEIELEDIIVTPMSVTGPYVVALHKEAADYIMEEGMMLADTNQDPPFTQFFSAKPFNASVSEVKISNNAEDIAMSIYFNLGAEYTGLKMNDLADPKSRILEALSEVFGKPSDFVSYTLIQPKTPLGFYRNAIRAIVKYNKQNENKVEPEEVNDLAKIRYVGMGFGKRPISSTMPTGWRAAYGIEPCCFRQKAQCTKSNGVDCDLRSQVWAKYSYTDKNLRPDFAEKKRKREEEQQLKRQQTIATYQQLQAERKKRRRLL